MLFIEYPKCTTCKKAKCYLENNKLNYTDRNIKEEKPNYEELKKWYEISGLDINNFFNTSGLLYKEMNLKEKLKTMTIEEKLKLLATNGMLIKRPLLIKANKVIIGFKEENWNNFFK